MSYNPVKWVEDNTHLTPRNLDIASERIAEEFDEVDKTFDLLADRDVIATAPSLSASVVPTEVEVGAQANIDFSFYLNPGKYKYNEEGQITNNEPTGVTVQKYTISSIYGDSETLDDGSGRLSSTVSGTIKSNVYFADFYNEQFKLTVYHSAGQTAYNNIARRSFVKIEEGSITRTFNVKSYRNIFYYTSKNLTDLTQLTSPLVRDSFSKTPAKNTSFQISIPDGTHTIIIAMPGFYKIRSITDANAGGMQDWYTSSAVDKLYIPIEGATEGRDSLDYEFVVIEDKTAAGLAANTFTVNYYQSVVIA